MHKRWKTLSLAAALLATGSATAAADEFADYYGDDNGNVGVANASNFIEDSTFVEDTAEPAEVVEPVAHVSDVYRHEVPVALEQHAAFDQPVGSMGHSVAPVSMDCGCSTTECQTCEPAMACKPSRKPARGGAFASCFDSCRPKHWLTAETLLWFPEARDLPVLITGHDTPATAPTLDDPGTILLFGGQDSVGNEISPGFRFDFGRYLSEDFGVGGRFWMIAEDGDSYATSGDGLGRTIGRPFFDVDTGLESALDVVYNDGTGNPPLTNGDAAFSGSISARSELSLYGAEGYSRTKMLAGKGFHADFLGGFSHFGIDDSLTVSSTSIQLDVDEGGNPTDTTELYDDIDAENRFFGGQLGLETVLNRGSWTLRALTKVHLGNMEQTFVGRGFRRFTDAGLVVTTDTLNPGGVLVVGDTTNGDLRNYGTIEEDVFTFAPELNLKLAYQASDNVGFSIGYSFIYWNNVVMVGDNLSNVYNGDGVTFPEVALTAPQFELVDRSMWVQGIDLGCIVQF
ncbi:MAG: BBP7 family outer membrane beta-barrel protein [Planctomycetota bacterium]